MQEIFKNIIQRRCHHNTNCSLKLKTLAANIATF